MASIWKRAGFVLAVTALTLASTFGAAEAWTLSGTVYGGGQPLAGTKVTVYDSGDQSEIDSGTTDVNGQYSIVLDSGTYNLLIAPPLSSSLANSVVDQIAVSADVTQNVVLVQQANVVGGTVKTKGGVAVSKVKVSILDSASGTTVGEQITDDAGAYAFPVSAGTYDITVTGGPAALYDSSLCGGFCFSNVPTPQYFRYDAIVSGMSVSGGTTRDLVLPLVTLSGTVTDPDGAPVPGVRIDQPFMFVMPDEGNFYSYYSSESDYTFVPGAVTDEAGRYLLGILEGSGYSIAASPPAQSPLALTVVNDIVVAGDSVRDITLQLATYLSGTVRTKGGAPVSKVKVVVLDQMSNSAIAERITNDQGEYSVAIADGTYGITVSGGPAALYDSSLCGGFCYPGVPTPEYFRYDYIASDVVVAGNTTRDLTLPLVTLSGTITDPDGAPVAGVKVKQGFLMVNPQPGNIGSSSYYSSESDYTFVPGAVSDGSGHYTLGMLEGNGYSLTLAPSGGAFAQSVVNGVDVLGDTVRDFTLQRVTYLSGTVKTKGGVPVSRVKVAVYDQASGTSVAEQITDGQGRYAIAIAAGTYKITLIGGPAALYDSSLCGGFCFPSVPTPQYFRYDAIASNVVVAGDTTRDLTLPLVSLSGKATDANGVPVPGVKVNQGFQMINPVPGNSNTYYSSESNYTFVPPAASDSTGSYLLGMLEGSGYSLVVVPPTGSGFSQTVLNNMNVTGSLLQNIILAMPDAAPPAILSGPTVSAATDATAIVEWQTNEPAKGGVAYGTANPPTTVLQESAFTVRHSVPLSSLTANTTYYVRVTASDATGNGPTTSKIVSFTTKPTPDTTAPVILTGPTVTGITHNGAVVEWSTNEPSTGTVVYGVDTSTGQSVSDTSLAVSHRVTLASLTPETLYYLKVSAADAAGNGPTSTSVISFRTVAAPDTTAPVILEGPMAINVSDTGATIVWKTDEPATTGVSWNDGTAYGVLSGDGFSTLHSLRISGLKSGTLYHFTAASKDGAGNGPTLSAEGAFTTLPTPDAKPPVIILEPLVKNVNHQMALIYWETDEPADSVIEYGTDGAFGSSDAKPELVTRHNRPLTGLVAGTTYYFRVLATDVAGNGPAVSRTYSFTTDTMPSTEGPAITKAPEVVYANDKAATVYFETDKPCDTVVEYGQGESLTNRQSDGEKVNKHQATVTNLTPNTSYGVKVSCTDLLGNTVSSAPAKRVASVVLTATFVTGAVSDTTAPVITVAPAAAALTPYQATITWNTDEISDSQVLYHQQGDSVTVTAGDISRVFSHSVVLTNLSPTTTYVFTVRSADPSGNGVTSDSYSFVTPSTLDGSCGSADGSVATVAPVTGLCATGTPSTVTGTNPWSWSCTGINGGAAATCGTRGPIDGACGTSDGKSFSAAPTTGLCSIGSATNVSGTGPWSWSCNGEFNGIAASCSASLAVPVKAGDSDNNGEVTIAEVQSAINMFLGMKAAHFCVDADGNNEVSIGEVQRVINAFLGM